MTTVTNATDFGNAIDDTAMLAVANLAAAPDVTAAEETGDRPTSSAPSRGLEGVIRIEEGRIEQHLSEVVRDTVEQTLNGLLDAEADRLKRLVVKRGSSEIQGSLMRALSRLRG